MYNHNKAQQSKNRVHISWDILYLELNKPNSHHITGAQHCITRELLRRKLFHRNSFLTQISFAHKSFYIKPFFISVFPYDVHWTDQV